jgi:UDP-glucose 4-epimerase
VIRILDNMRQGQIRALMDLPTATYEFIEGDLLDPSVLRLALRGVDTVVHLAAVVRTPLSFENPAWLEQVNHWGTAQLVEACLNQGVTRVIFTSTAAVYGPDGPHREDGPCRPQGAYAHSKLAAEKVLLTARSRGLTPILLRVGTLFGLAPVTRFDAVVNRFAYLAGIRQPLTVYGDGQQRRPVVHVRDAAAAVCHVVQTELPGPIYNLVGETASVLDIVAALRRARPETPVHFTEQDIRTHVSFAADPAALIATGWRPQVSLALGVTELLDQFQFIRRSLPTMEDLEDI